MNKIFKKTQRNRLFCFVLVPFFCSMVHNAHNSSLHDPQCTRICATPTLHYVPPFHTHATTHPLASMCSPALHQHTRFPGSEHKRKKNIRFEGNKTIASICVCVRMHWREREGYTHTLVKGIWRSHFFFSFFYFRALQSNLAIFL